MRDIIFRAGKTFLQAVIAYIFTLNLSGVDFTDKNVIIGIVTAAVAAGFSALMNFDWSGAEAKTKADEADDTEPQG